MALTSSIAAGGSPEHDLLGPHHRDGALSSPQAHPGGEAQGFAQAIDDETPRRVDESIEAIGPADELGDIRGCRSAIDVFRGRHLLEAPAIHHRDLVRHRHRFGLIMGHHDGGDAEATLQLAQLLAHRETQLGIEGGERLVEQEHRRLDDQRAGEGHTLLLTAGELPRAALGELLHLDQPQGPRHALARLRARHAAHAQPERHVARDREMREQREVLEHHAKRSMPGR